MHNIFDSARDKRTTWQCFCLIYYGLGCCPLPHILDLSIARPNKFSEHRKNSNGNLYSPHKLLILFGINSILLLWNFLAIVVIAAFYCYVFPLPPLSLSFSLSFPLSPPFSLSLASIFSPVFRILHYKRHVKKLRFHSKFSIDHITLKTLLASNQYASRTEKYTMSPWSPFYSYHDFFAESLLTRETKMHFPKVSPHDSFQYKNKASFLASKNRMK